MLDVGFSEILLTSAIALIVLGPERLPKVARQVGNWMGRARTMARQLSEQLEREVSAEELLKAQSKPNPNVYLPDTGAGFDPAHTPSIAPPSTVAPPAMETPPAVAPSPEAAAPSAADSPGDAAASPVIAPARASTSPPVKVPHPTSAAAMHAADVSPQAELALSDPRSPAAEPINTPHE
jgi:sec-independent protein translocase protein TatB